MREAIRELHGLGFRFDDRLMKHCETPGGRLVGCI